MLVPASVADLNNRLVRQRLRRQGGRRAPCIARAVPALPGWRGGSICVPPRPPPNSVTPSGPLGPPCCLEWTTPQPPQNPSNRASKKAAAPCSRPSAPPDTPGAGARRGRVVVCAALTMMRNWFEFDVERGGGELLCKGPSVELQKQARQYSTFPLFKVPLTIRRNITLSLNERPLAKAKAFFVGVFL